MHAQLCGVHWVWPCERITRPGAQASSPRAGFKLPDTAAVQATSSALAASGFTVVQTPIVQGGQVHARRRP